MIYNRLCGLIDAKESILLSMMVDNSGSISSKRNQPIHERRKHIEIRYHYVRESLAATQVIVSYFRTEEYWR